MRGLLAAVVIGVVGCGGRPCEPREVPVTRSFEADLPGMYAVCGIDSCWTTTFFADGGYLNEYARTSGTFFAAWLRTDAGFEYEQNTYAMAEVTDAGLVLNGRLHSAVTCR